MREVVEIDLSNLPEQDREWISENSGKAHHNSHVWSAEDDALILAARKSGVYWNAIAKRLGVCIDTARIRYSELTGR